MINTLNIEKSHLINCYIKAINCRLLNCETINYYVHEIYVNVNLFPEKKNAETFKRIKS